MKKASLLLMGILAFLFISSCTIQKRTVNKGYFVQWHWNNKIKSTPVEEDRVVSPEPGIEETAEIQETPIFLEAENVESPGEEILDAVAVTEEKTEAVTNFSHKMADFNEDFKLQRMVVGKKLHEMKQSPPPMDVELAVNIGLLVLFLALAILFTIFALNAAAGTMLFVWWALAGLCFIIFVTQVIDVILW
ncbi:MAG: hypothetical protein K0R65_2108 [Crocinitomicaceae bacterium]|nr:hypothetical protein [Crocinitomicaceae bacterium]